MIRPIQLRLAAVAALIPLSAGFSLALSGGLQKKEIVFGCALALFHGFSSALFHRIAIGQDTTQFMLWGVLAPVFRTGISAVILVGVYSLAGLSRPDVFLAVGLAGVLCMEAGEILALHFKPAE
jgi:lysylphosphatidylglycerol synthetase-like protein (DUF2156 family)